MCITGISYERNISKLHRPSVLISWIGRQETLISKYSSILVNNLTAVVIGAWPDWVIPIIAEARDQICYTAASADHRIPIMDTCTWVYRMRMRNEECLGHLDLELNRITIIFRERYLIILNISKKNNNTRQDLYMTHFFSSILIFSS